MRFLFIILLFFLTSLSCDRSEFGKSSNDEVLKNSPHQDLKSGGNNSTDSANNVNQTNSSNGHPTIGIKRAHIALPLSKIYQTFSTPNFVFSPTDLHQLLGGIYLVSEGKTKTDLADFLKIESIEELNQRPKDHRFSALWIDDNVEISQNLIDQFFELKMTVRRTDLQSPESRTRINNVVREETEGYITELFSPLEDLSKGFILANSSYYLGFFEEAFDEKKTYKNTFFGTNPSDREFMVGQGSFNVLQSETITALSLPFQEEKVLMLVMPSQLSDVEDLLSQDFLERILNELHEEYVEIHVPKMDFSSAFSTQKIVNLLALDEESDYSKLAGQDLSAAVHKVRFVLNEKGARILDDFDENIDPKTEEIRFDRPFIFMVYDKETQSIDYLGRLSE